MSRGAISIKQADITRALRAAIAAGIEVRRIEIEPASGKITITARGGAENEEITDLDKWIATHAR